MITDLYQVYMFSVGNQQLAGEEESSHSSLFLLLKGSTLQQEAQLWLRQPAMDLRNGSLEPTVDMKTIKRQHLFNHVEK